MSYQTHSQMKHCYHCQYILLIWLFCLCSCQDEFCVSNTDEPKLLLSFIDTTTNLPVNPLYNRVYAVTEDNQVKADIKYIDGRDFYELPLSTFEDQVTYVLEKTDQTPDTVIITYDRLFRLDDNPECGLGILLDNVALSTQSTLIAQDTSSYFFITPLFRNDYTLHLVF